MRRSSTATLKMSAVFVPTALEWWSSEDQPWLVALRCGIDHVCDRQKNLPNVQAVQGTMMWSSSPQLWIRFDGHWT